MTKTPSRILNEPSGFMGLGSFDIAGIGYLLILSYHFFILFNLELISFPLTALAFLVLVNIRGKFRPKIIRDYIKFLKSKRISYYKAGLL